MAVAKQLASKVWSMNEKLYEHFSGQTGPTHVSTNGTVSVNGFKMQKPKDPDDYDENDAWDDVKKARENIGAYEAGITGTTQEREKKLADYIRPKEQTSFKNTADSFQWDTKDRDSPTFSRPA